METLHRHRSRRGTQKRSPPAGSAGSTAATALTPTPRARIRWKQHRTKCEPTDTPPVPARGTDRDAEGHAMRMSRSYKITTGCRNSDAGPEREQTVLLLWLEKRLQHRVHGRGYRIDAHDIRTCSYLRSGHGGPCDSRSHEGKTPNGPPEVNQVVLMPPSDGLPTAPVPEGDSRLPTGIDSFKASDGASQAFVDAEDPGANTISMFQSRSRRAGTGSNGPATRWLQYGLGLRTVRIRVRPSTYDKILLRTASVTSVK
ncbi:hypothetical protein EDB85DRAFT_1899939 [Lactarius pseudohatsudake]|nr:hypothetical protein EDB85DRAFT_1899939 [Lactarius pseudohatsudake]